MDADTNMPYHTFTTKDQKQNTFVAKGLPADASVEEITEELTHKYGLAPARCTKMKNTKRTVYIISFNSEITLKHLERARCIAYTRISWERYVNAKRLSQCHRCQEWGHATTNCRAKPKCLICAKSHLTFTCELKGTKNTTGVKCANCDGKHPANSVDCPVYIRKIEWLDNNRKVNRPQAPQQKPKQTPPSVDRFNFPRLKPAPLPKDNKWFARANQRTEVSPTTTASNNNIGYSARAGEIESASDNHNSDPMCGMNTLTNELNKLDKLIDINKMIGLVRDLNNKLTSCQTEMEKFQCFYKFCQQLNG